MFIQPTYATMRPSIFIPPELVREIVASLFESPRATLEDELGVSVKHNWSSIQSLSLTSKTYRTLALEAWFRTLFIKDPLDIKTLQDFFPEIGKAIRELHCVQTATRITSVWNLQDLKHLSKIRLDWLSRSIMIPHHSSKDPADRLPFTHISSSIVELDIRGLPWPSPMVFHNIHSILPDLRILRLRQQRIWCGLCHTCSVARFKSPGPDKLVYEGGCGLPVHYAHAFRSLQHLHTVIITIPDFGGGKTALGNDQEHNQDLWAGECDRCMEIMYEDGNFRNQYVARKQGLASSNKDTFRMVYVPPPSLKRVEWTFWRAEGCEEVDVQESGDELSESDEDS